MSYILVTYWFASLCALVAGFAAAAWLRWRSGPDDSGLSGWLRLAVTVFLVGFLVAVLGWLPGRPGLDLETFLLLLFAMIVGSLLALLLPRAQPSRDSQPATDGLQLAELLVAAEPVRAAAAQAEAPVATGPIPAERVLRPARDADNSVEPQRPTTDAVLPAPDHDDHHAVEPATAAEETASGDGAGTAGPDAENAVGAPVAAPVVAAATAAPPPTLAEVESHAAATVAATTDAAGSATKPAGIAEPHGGVADDLKLIKGIGPKNEQICNDLGIYHFFQIADWTPDEAEWVSHHLAFPGRILREHWIAQARLLAAGGATPHSEAVRAGTAKPDAASDAPLDADEAARLGASLPQQGASVPGESDHAGRRPYGLLTALAGQHDDLKKIRGIGPQNESRLNALGIWHFRQIAAWSADNVTWVGSYLAFPGRITREAWIDQAKDLAAGRVPKVASRPRKKG